MPVVIDGESFWDGGYRANPPLQQLIADGRRDALLVLLVPTRVGEPPQRPADVRARADEFAFTAGFVRESEMLAAATERAVPDLADAIRVFSANLRDTAR